MTTNSIPALNLPSSYINGMQLAWASTTTLTVKNGQCRDSQNVFDIVVSTASTTINGAANGLNGLDTGSLATSTLYYVFAIAASTAYQASGFIISASATPVLPSGYDIYRRIGYARTDGSSHFLMFYQSGIGGSRKYILDAPISVLSGGSSATFVALDLSGAIPPIDKCLVGLQASFTPNAAGDIATIRPSGSSSTTSLIISGVVAAKAQQLSVESMALLISGVPKIDYEVTASGALTLLVASFVDSL
jgi:hypothetical protein